MVIFNSYVKLPEGIDTWLVVWHIFYFPFHIWDVILPIDELIFFRGVGQPPTRYLWHMVSILSSFHFWFVIVISKKFVWPWQDRAMRLAHSLGLPLGTSLKQRKKPGVSESRGQSQTFSMGYIGRCSKVADFSSHGLKSCRTGWWLAILIDARVGLLSKRPWRFRGPFAKPTHSWHILVYTWPVAMKKMVVVIPSYTSYTHQKVF